MEARKGKKRKERGKREGKVRMHETSKKDKEREKCKRKKKRIENREKT